MKDITINNTTLSFNEIIYVDAVNGNDTTGDGTESNPVKTIQKAQTLISVDNTAILLADGEYNEVLVKNPASFGGREYALFISRSYSYSVVSLNPTSTFINVTFNRNYCYLISQTNVKEINLYNLNINIDMQYNFASGGYTTIISDGANSSAGKKFRSYNCVYNYVGVSSYNRGLVYINSPVDWEFDNCIFCLIRAIRTQGIEIIIQPLFLKIVYLTV